MRRTLRAVVNLLALVVLCLGVIDTCLRTSGSGLSAAQVTQLYAGGTYFVVTTLAFALVLNLLALRDPAERTHPPTPPQRPPADQP